MRVLIAASLAAACGDEPMKPVAAVPNDALPAVGAATTCDKYWTIAVSGDWDDPLRWSPSGVPGSSENVCFAAAGSYSVTLSNTGTSIRDLEIRNGVDVTFDGQQSPLTSTGRYLSVHGTLTIDRTARMSTAGCAAL